jgi:hypothetical protein
MEQTLRDAHPATGAFLLEIHRLAPPAKAVRLYEGWNELVSNKERGVSATGRFFLIFLFILILISLALNLFLLREWLTFQRQAITLRETTQALLSEAIVQLGTFENSTIEFSVPVNEQVPIQVAVPFSKTLEIPIKTSIPISQTVHTTATVNAPPLGLSVPVAVSVPVKMDVPLDLNVPVSVNETIPISTSVALKLDIPVSVEISQTGLAKYVEQLRAMLASIQKALNDLER